MGRENEEIVYDQVPEFDSDEEELEWAKKVIASGNNVAAKGDVMMYAMMYHLSKVVPLNPKRRRFDLIERSQRLAKQQIDPLDDSSRTKGIKSLLYIVQDV